MPLHFGTISKDSPFIDALVWILQEGMDESDSVFITKDGRYVHSQTPVRDVLTGEEIGKIVYTIKNDDEQEALELLDMDFILNSDEYASMRFLGKRRGSSDSNEYYDVEMTGTGQHLQIETVNRHTVEGEIEGSERKARISVFPFELSVYKDMDALNARFGFNKVIEVADTGIKVGGFSETFAMPGGAFREGSEDESFSFLIGRVKSFRDVQVRFGEVSWDFVIANVLTALGTVPVAMEREIFDLSELKPEAVVSMNADVKADLSRPEDFIYPELHKEIS